MASYPVKTLSSLITSSLPVNGVAQSLRSVLRAGLVTGFGTMAVSSLTVAGGVATASFAAVHPYRVDLVVRVVGAGLAAANGEQRITAVTTNSASFALPGAPDGPISGSGITMEVAPLGWLEPFTNGAVSVFKPSVLEATGMLLRLDDAGTTNARARAFESMTDQDSGVGPCPLDTQVSGGLYWPKSGAASATARPWFLTGDSRGFYYAVSPQGTDRYTLMYVGDIDGVKSGDAWAFTLTGNQGDQVDSVTAPDGCCGWSHRNARGGAYLSRLHTGVGQSTPAQRIGSHHTGISGDTYAGVAGYGWGTYPNGPNNGLMVGKLELFANGVRGTFPGLWHPFQDCGNAFSSGVIVDGTDDLAGHKLMALRVAPPSGSVVAGTVFVDLTTWGR